MNKRLETIYQSLAPCKKLADVGCDHGYIADAMLSRGKAERAVISDISAPSLKKAADLLERNHPGRYTAVVCDGLKGVDSDCDQVLIAKSDMASLVDSLVAPMSVVNALIVALAAEKEQTIAKTFDTLERVWEEYNVYEKRTDRS